MHTSVFAFLAIVLVVAAAVLMMLAPRIRPREDLFAKPWPLEAKPQLLSEPERALYQRLVKSLPNHIVLAQVQLLQVLNFKRGHRTHAILNRISQLSLDFLILNIDTSIVAAVELDDATHALENRLRADDRRAHALQSAGVPLIRWKTNSVPDRAAILEASRARQPHRALISPDRIPCSRCIGNFSVSCRQLSDLWLRPSVLRRLILRFERREVAAHYQSPTQSSSS